MRFVKWFVAPALIAGAILTAVLSGAAPGDPVYAVKTSGPFTLSNAEGNCLAQRTKAFFPRSTPSTLRSVELSLRDNQVCMQATGAVEQHVTEYVKGPDHPQAVFSADGSTVSVHVSYGTRCRAAAAYNAWRQCFNGRGLSFGDPIYSWRISRPCITDSGSPCAFVAEDLWQITTSSPAAYGQARANGNARPHVGVVQ